MNTHAYIFSLFFFSSLFVCCSSCAFFVSLYQKARIHIKLVDCHHSHASARGARAAKIPLRTHQTTIVKSVYAVGIFCAAHFSFYFKMSSSMSRDGHWRANEAESEYMLQIRRAGRMRKKLDIEKKKNGTSRQNHNSRLAIRFLLIALYCLWSRNLKYLVNSIRHRNEKWWLMITWCWC